MAELPITVHCLITSPNGKLKDFLNTKKTKSSFSMIQHKQATHKPHQ
jgi:hypothetical protein